MRYRHPCRFRCLMRRRTADSEREHAAQACLSFWLGLEHCDCSTGALRRIELRRHETARIEHVEVSQFHPDDGTAEVCVKTTVLARKNNGRASFAISFNGETRFHELELSSGEHVLREQFVIQSPQLWWPAGHGSQHLYPLEVAIDGEVEKRQIGLRTIELLTDKDGAGSRFAFKVNGREIYCRGSNWIPPMRCLRQRRRN